MKTEKQQTAVEWLFRKTLEMEKEQIVNAYRRGFISDDIKLADDYYNDESKCVFEARTDTTSSATICKWCGQEKFLHKY